jgi:energy-coupling factor transport system permease protein
LVLLFTMFLFHPVFLFLSLAGAVSYAVYLNGKKAARLLLMLLPLLLITAGIGAAFNHEGVTILAYFRNGNPLTLESIAAGLAAAVMLVAAVCWFSCYSAVMTTDKFLYLFGRVIPALSLLLSMTLRFVPRLRAQGKIIADAQHSIGRGIKDGRLLRRAANGMRILSILTTWALENAVETADSMRSRGYGLPGRTAFALYRFDGRDGKLLLAFSLCGAYLFTGALLGRLHYRFYPSLGSVGTGPYALSLYFVYIFLCFAPVIINHHEDRKWEALRSEI